jgi:hypothetical protein
MARSASCQRVGRALWANTIVRSGAARESQLAQSTSTPMNTCTPPRG